MKNLKIKRLLLSFILSIASINQVWAWYNFGDNYGSTQVKIWFDNSSTNLQNVKIYFEHPDNGSYSVDYSFTQISGTDYWEISTNYAGFKKFEIHGRPQNSESDWGWKTDAKTDEIWSGCYARCLSPSTTSGQAGSWTVPGLKNVSYTRNSTTTSNTLAGSGTSVSPYVIKPGTAIGVQLSGDLIDGNCTKYYKFGGGSATTTATKQVVASAVKGTAYSMSAATGAKRDTYESRYTSAGTLYFTTAYSMSASVSGSHGSVGITSGGNYVYSGNTSFTVTASPDTGYEVDSWSVTGGTKSGSGNEISVTASGTADCSVTVSFKAKKYTITLHDNNGQADNGSATATYDSNTLTNIDPPTKTGYNVEGYYTSSNCTTKVATTAGALQNSITVSTTPWTNASGQWKATAGKTFYADWTAKNYSVTLDKNGGDSDGSITTTYDSSTGSSFSAASYAGYSCDGYFTEDDGGYEIIDKDGNLKTGTVSDWLSSGAWVKDGANIKLYAHWTEDITNYTVTYDVVGHGELSAANSSTSATITSGDKVANGTGVTFTADPDDYYEVEGWYTDEDCTEGKHDAEETEYSTTISSADLAVYVKFQPTTYTISYTLNGGSNHGSNPNSYNYESSAITLQDPNRSGYTFGGWYTESTLENRVYSIAAKSNGDKAYWAKWTANPYTITLNNHDATTAGTTSISVTFDATTNLTGTPAITVPQKDGYTFGGYYTGENGTGTQIIAANGNVNASASGGGNTYTSASKQWKYAGDIN